jgi:hypothetical protein
MYVRLWEGVCEAAQSLYWELPTFNDIHNFKKESRFVVFVKCSSCLWTKNLWQAWHSRVKRRSQKLTLAEIGSNHQKTITARITTFLYSFSSFFYSAWEVIILPVLLSEADVWTREYIQGRDEIEGSVSSLSAGAYTHKVRIYEEYHSVCPLVGIGTLPTPLLPASVSLPPETGGRGRTRLQMRGWGSSNSDDWSNSLALCLLCAYTSICTWW